MGEIGTTTVRVEKEKRKGPTAQNGDKRDKGGKERSVQERGIERSGDSERSSLDTFIASLADSLFAPIRRCPST